MLSSKVAQSNQSYNVSLNTRPSRATKVLRRLTTTSRKDGVAGPSSRAAEDNMQIRACASGANSSGRRSESQERIIRHEAFGMAESDVDLGVVGVSHADGARGGG